MPATNINTVVTVTAEQPQTRFTLDGRNIGDLSKVFTLHGIVGSGGNVKATVRLLGATSGYLVPAGYKLIILGSVVCGTGAVTTTELHTIYQTDNDLGQQSVAGFINGIFIGPFLDGRTSGAGNTFYLSKSYPPVGPNKYVTVTAYNNSDLVITLICKLQAV